MMHKLGSWASLAVAAICLLACSTSTPAQRTTSGHKPGSVGIAEQIGAQPLDLLTLTRCPQPTGPDSVAAALAANGDDYSAKKLAQDWNDLKSVGALDAYLVGYVSSASDCSVNVFGASRPTPFLTDLLVTFANPGKAQAAWKAGTLFGDPSQLGTYGGVVGAGTGLGDYSATIQYTGFFTALWTNGPLLSFMQTSYGPTIGTHVAQSLDRRMSVASGETSQRPSPSPSHGPPMPIDSCLVGRWVVMSTSLTDTTTVPGVTLDITGGVGEIDSFTADGQETDDYSDASPYLGSGDGHSLTYSFRGTQQYPIQAANGKWTERGSDSSLKVVGYVLDGVAQPASISPGSAATGTYSCSATNLRFVRITPDSATVDERRVG